MKFVVSRQELSNLIRKIQNVVPQNAPMPILSHLLLEANGEELTVTATDLTLGARCTTKAKVYEEGSLPLPSRRFVQLVRELTDPQVEITAAAGESAEIKSGTACFRLHGMDKNDYPSLPDLQAATRFTISTETLHDMLFRTAFAVSKEDNRYVLTGVLMRLEQGKAIFVGTDGKRLAKAETAVDLDPTFSQELILPIKAVDEILKCLTEEEEEAVVYLTADKMALEVGKTLFITKLLAGEYPDFEQVIPKESKVSVALHREELMTLLRQISLFTTDISHSVRFTFLPGELVLTANSAEIGEGKVSMPVHYTGSKLEIAFNPHYFLDILRHSHDEAVTIRLSDAYNPGVITDSTASLFLLMPMRLHDA